MNVPLARRRRCRTGGFALVLLLLARSGLAQSDPSTPDREQKAGRLFGVLPNNTTVPPDAPVRPLTTKEAFTIATLDSFDPYVLPLVGVMAGVSHMQNEPPAFGRGLTGYTKRYVTAFSDSAISNVMTVAVLPTLLRQDPRYYELGEGGFWHRAGYAASRSVITRGRSGRTQFNFSEIGGDALAVGVSNAYYPEANRTWEDNLTRWAMVVMWHTLSNEIREFWPDIRRRIKKDPRITPAPMPGDLAFGMQRLSLRARPGSI